MSYLRPLAQVSRPKPAAALDLAQGPAWFQQVERLYRDKTFDIKDIADISPAEVEDFLTSRPPIAGLSFDVPRIMGILNVTPDSFSDGGRLQTPQAAVQAALDMVAQGVDILDIGGESTRPGAHEVPVSEEIDRVVPAIAAIRAAGVTTPISVDTRKAAVADAALDAGTTLVNDVSGFTFDAALAPLCIARGVPVCVMHSQGTPQTMQTAPSYEAVCLDVFDWLQARIAALVAQGLPRTRIIADPGIGFGKTQSHNLALLQRVSLFHGLGVPVLLGASRKRFIGEIGNAPRAEDRGPGSIAVALAAIAQGVQVIRVHDVAQTRQAVALWDAVRRGEG